MRPVLPVQRPQLGGAFYAARHDLVKVDVGDGGVVCVGILLQVLGDGGHADGFAGEPADALEGEDGVGVAGFFFILRRERALAGCWGWGGVVDGKGEGGFTMSHLPLRSLMVAEGGAAIVKMLY